MSSLHLDAEEEPRRSMGANSRANSVRFDETANQGHWAHASRSSVDLIPRMSSALSGLAMTERTSSHKSDGRASSAHSMRSAASGRANSLHLDTGYSLGDSNRSPQDTPGLAPGLMLLRAVPAIIRCWMNTNFKHDALLYAAVCTGSYMSFLDLSLIQKLGFEDSIKIGEDGARTVKLPVFFPEAVPHPASSRSSSPAPQLPTLTVDFQVVERPREASESKAIQIFLGSDILRAHNADILFSSNSMTLFDDDDRSKLSIPLVRPENEATFRDLYITSGYALHAPSQPTKVEHDLRKEQPYLNGLGQSSSVASCSSVGATPPPSGKYRPPGALAADTGTDSAKPGALTSEAEARPSSEQSNASRPSLLLINTRTDAVEPSAEVTPLRSGSGPAKWSNWRRDGAASATVSPQPGTLDWAAAGKRDSSYQRKDTGIKILKPKTASRTFSTTAASASSPAGDGKSRFFDEGRRRSGTDNAVAKPTLSASDSTASSEGRKENVGQAYSQPKTRTNPVGGASAFTWMNSVGSGSKQ